MSSEISSAAAALGRMGGASRSPAKKAAARANVARARAAVSTDRRREIAQAAARARWSRVKPVPK